MKKLLSAALALSLAISMTAFGSSAVSSDFSTTPVSQSAYGVDQDAPNSSRFRYVTEISPNVQTKTVVISETDAKIQSTIIDIFASAMGEAAGKLSADPGLSAAISTGVEKFYQHLNKTIPGSKAGTYTVSLRYKTQYAVHLSTGARHVENKWLLMDWSLVQNGEVITEYSRQLTLR